MSNQFKTYDEPEETPVSPVSEPVAPVKKKKGKAKRVLIYSLGVLVLVGIVAIFFLAGEKQQSEHCWKVEVEIADQNGRYFITPAEVLALVQTKKDSLVGKSISAIKVDVLREKIMKNPSVKNADVYTTVDGRVMIHIDQRLPIARVINQDGSSLYIDQEGFTMPVTGGYAIKLPVFTGIIQEKTISGSILEARQNSDWAYRSMLDDIYFFTQHIRKDEFLMAQVEHVYIDHSRTVQIIPRVGNHRIYIGDVNHLDKKFKKLKTFYANTLQTRDLNIYESIHLEFEGQVVCERKQ
ncbi:MAG: cell division protein FtsQ/DivIB [Flavobacteriales bacterium]